MGNADATLAQALGDRLARVWPGEQAETKG
jgi:hypothetical protein